MSIIWKYFFISLNNESNMYLFRNAQKGIKTVLNVGCLEKSRQSLELNTTCHTTL